MNRRKFLQGMLAGVASVAIATKMAPKFPEFGDKTYSLGYTITSEETEDGLYGDIGERYAKALARSMMQTREVIGSRVLA